MVDAGRQESEAFLEEIQAVDGLGTGARASDVDHVGAVGGEAEQVAIEEDRAHLEEVGEVAGAEIRIIQEDGIALLKLIQRVLMQDVPDYEGHRAKVTGAEVPLGHEPTLGVEEGGGEVSALAHAEGVGRPAKRRTHLLCDGCEAVPNHAESYGIDIAHGIFFTVETRPGCCRTCPQWRKIREAGQLWTRLLL